MLFRLRDGDIQEYYTIAGILPHLRYSEKMINKVIECRECWKERIIDRDGEVKESLMTIAQNIKKVPGVSKELKAKADELNKVLQDLVGAPPEPAGPQSQSAQKAEFVRVNSSNKKRRLKRDEVQLEEEDDGEDEVMEP